jgi:hypothetical protein
MWSALAVRVWRHAARFADRHFCAHGAHRRYSGTPSARFADGDTGRCSDTGGQSQRCQVHGHHPVLICARPCNAEQVLSTLLATRRVVTRDSRGRERVQNVSSIAIAYILRMRRASCFLLGEWRMLTEWRYG